MHSFTPAMSALAILLATCTRTNGTTYAVHLSACIEPQAGYARAHVGDADQFGGAHFVMDDDPGASAAAATVTVDCGGTRDGAPAELDLTHDVVRIDLTQVQGELAFAAVFLHEAAGHWQVFHGPHPEHATVHPCQSQGDLGDPALCQTDHYRADMVMAATGPGIGHGDGGWSGLIEEGGVPNFQVTLEDQEFLAWALAP